MVFFPTFTKTKINKMQVNNTSLMDGMGEFQAAYWMSFDRNFCVRWDRQTESFNVWCTDEQCAGRMLRNMYMCDYVLTKQPVLVAKETLAWTRQGGRMPCQLTRDEASISVYIVRDGWMPQEREGWCGIHLANSLVDIWPFKAVLMTLPSDWPVDPVHDFFKYQGSRMWSTCRSAFDHYWLPPQESGQLWRLARPKWGSQTLHNNLCIYIYIFLDPMKYPVVVSNMFFFTLTWGRFPIWLIFVQRVETTN